MHIMKSGRVMVATLMVAGLTASSAVASGGPVDLRTPDAQDAAAALTAAKTADHQSPGMQDRTSRPDTAGNGKIGKDLRTTSSLAGPPPGSGGIYVPPAADVAPLPGPPQFPTNTVPLSRPEPEPVPAPSAGDGFDIGDAAIGAAGAAVLVVAGAGAFAMSRRRRIATPA